VLSAKATVDDRIKGLQAGSDDYLTKPFAFSELLARVQALIRRATQS
jgi:two-component system OmpR family response regulator